MSETVRRNRTVSPAEYEELQELIFDLVRERVLAAIGAGGMWSINFRNASDTDAFFGETVAERIAKDVAAQIAPRSSASDEPIVVAPTSSEIELHTGEISLPVTVEASSERVVWVAEPSQVAWVAEFAEASRAGDRDHAEGTEAAETTEVAGHEHRRLVA
ncbi:MAG TPA: hypothetical protein DCP11_02275 [Microbacteriaceae bacterium]|jgi:hypothetical protein|nr:hypothetical protein [Microbacteriaceae bacterium]